MDGRLFFSAMVNKVLNKAYSEYRISEVGDMGIWRPSGDQSGMGSWRVDSGYILRSF